MYSLRWPEGHAKQASSVHNKIVIADQVPVQLEVVQLNRFRIQGSILRDKNDTIIQNSKPLDIQEILIHGSGQLLYYMTIQKIHDMIPYYYLPDCEAPPADMTSLLRLIKSTDLKKA